MNDKTYFVIGQRSLITRGLFNNNLIDFKTLATLGGIFPTSHTYNVCKKDTHSVRMVSNIFFGNHDSQEDDARG